MRTACLHVRTHRHLATCKIAGTNLVENVLCNDLIRREYDVDLGDVKQNIRNENKKNAHKQSEVDFVGNRGFV